MQTAGGDGLVYLVYLQPDARRTVSKFLYISLYFHFNMCIRFLKHALFGFKLISERHILRMESLFAIDRLVETLLA